MVIKAEFDTYSYIYIYHKHTFILDNIYVYMYSNNNFSVGTGREIKYIEVDVALSRKKALMADRLALSSGQSLTTVFPTP